MTILDGVFHRIGASEADALAGAKSPEGRFHHSGQAALYMSPKVEWAIKAVEPYRRPGDPLGVAYSLRVARAAVVDLREASHCEALGIDPGDASTPWLPQRQAGARPDSWRPADIVRSSGASGLIYTARSDAARWHLVLFRWNDLGGPSVVMAESPVRVVLDEAHVRQG